jgi:hypothetical protein
MLIGNNEHPMDVIDIADGAHYPPGVNIDLDDLAGPQVSDKQQPFLGVQAGVVKPRIITRQRHLPNHPQRQRSSRSMMPNRVVHHCQPDRDARCEQHDNPGADSQQHPARPSTRRAAVFW